MKKTKIIATIGPASANYETLKSMILNGMNVARINLSHGKKEEHLKNINLIKKLRKELNAPVAVMLDTRGPDVRVKTFENGFVEIKKGQHFTFKKGEEVGNNTFACITNPCVFKIIKKNQKVFANDGTICFVCKEVHSDSIVCVAKNSGKISNNKSLCFQKMQLNIPYLNKEDVEDLTWGLENDIDYIAASFVSSTQDIDDIKNLFKKLNKSAKIICKIENLMGIKNLDSIIDNSDGVMVARGDLGVELPLSKIPAYQKEIISKCNKKGKICITATEMLESMINSIRPTRAEASDVANAVYDGTSAVMLSAESAVGKYPTEAIKTMAQICADTEKAINYSAQFSNLNLNSNSISELIARAGVEISFAKEIKAMVVFTKSGLTAQRIAKYKPNCPVITATSQQKTYNELALCFGAIPTMVKAYKLTEDMFAHAKEIAEQFVNLKPGDEIIVISGEPNLVKGTNLLKILTI